MVEPAAVPDPVHALACPETDQPGNVFRLSVTTIGVVAPVAASAEHCYVAFALLRTDGLRAIAFDAKHSFGG